MSGYCPKCKSATYSDEHECGRPTALERERDILHNGSNSVFAKDDTISLFLHEQRMAALQAKYDELLSYLPKVPTAPYERELAQQLAAVTAELEDTKAAASIHADEHRKARQMCEKLAKALEHIAERKQPSCLGCEYLQDTSREALAEYEEMK